MKTRQPLRYQRHRFPSEIISHAVWLFHRLCFSFREVEELLADRRVTVTYETVLPVVPGVWVGLCEEIEEASRALRGYLVFG